MNVLIDTFREIVNSQNTGFASHPGYTFLTPNASAITPATALISQAFPAVAVINEETAIQPDNRHALHELMLQEVLNELIKTRMFGTYEATAEYIVSRQPNWPYRSFTNPESDLHITQPNKTARILNGRVQALSKGFGNIEDLLPSVIIFPVFGLWENRERFSRVLALGGDRAPFYIAGTAIKKLWPSLIYVMTQETADEIHAARLPFIQTRNIRVPESALIS